MAGLQVAQDWLRRIAAIELVEEWEDDETHNTIYQPLDLPSMVRNPIRKSFLVEPNSNANYLNQFEELPEDYYHRAFHNWGNPYMDGIPYMDIPGQNADAKKRLADKG